jgi:nucleotidyltransferase substrate binding protein (TIGR01987 family)
MIQVFKFTHELAWNVMKDYFAYQGNPGIAGSRDAAREAFQSGLIENSEGWMEMIRSRNLISHTYQQTISDEICVHIVARYVPLFEHFLRRMNVLKAQS